MLRTSATIVRADGTPSPIRNIEFGYHPHRMRISRQRSFPVNIFAYIIDRQHNMEILASSDNGSTWTSYIRNMPTRDGAEYIMMKNTKEYHRHTGKSAYFNLRPVDLAYQALQSKSLRERYGPPQPVRLSISNPLVRRHLARIITESKYKEARVLRTEGEVKQFCLNQESPLSLEPLRAPALLTHTSNCLDREDLKSMHAHATADAHGPGLVGIQNPYTRAPFEPKEVLLIRKLLHATH